MALIEGPELNIVIDKMLTQRDAKEGKDPLDPGEFPSLGFKNETRHSYHMQIRNEADTILVTIWRSGNAFDVSSYKRSGHNGVIQWGGDGKRVHCEDLLQVQITVHHIFTPEGNIYDVER